MPAAGIRPEPGKMVLTVGATLQKQLTRGIENEYGESAMKQTFSVDIELTGKSLHSVQLIHQDYLLLTVR